MCERKLLFVHDCIITAITVFTTFTGCRETMIYTIPTLLFTDTIVPAEEPFMFNYVL